MNLTTKGFYDCCIPFQNDKVKMISILKEASKLGYRTVAIEQIFDHSKKDYKKSSDIFPEPIQLDFLNDFKYNLKILSRLTIVYSDLSVAHQMSTSLNLRKFNIVAGLPKNESTLNHCFTTFNGDIISLSPTGPKLLVKRKPYQVAVARGMYLEIKYSDAIQDSTYRKDLIKFAHNYHIKGKSKNIIFSSGAKTIFELRSPYDVANLAIIFGLSEEQGKSSVSSMCRLLILRAESRRIGKTNTIANFSKNENEINEENNSSDEEDSEMDIFDTDLEQQPLKKMKIS